MKKENLIKLIENQLLEKLSAESVNPFDPVQVRYVPKGWKCLGTGNYAAVFTHSRMDDWVVKVYIRNVYEIEDEAEVYKRLGNHSSYSQLIHKGDNYLILKKLEGITLYNAIHEGIKIPEQVIKDIKKALKYAKEQGLNPIDVHGKNVMMHKGRGYVVDVSDFLKEGQDTKWRDLEKAYYKFYLKTIHKCPFRVKVPYFVLDMVRHSYRKAKKLRNLNAKTVLYKKHQGRNIT